MKMRDHQLNMPPINVDIHPEIRKFWENAGYEIGSSIGASYREVINLDYSIQENDKWRCLFFIMKDGQYVGAIALSDIITGIKNIQPQFIYMMGNKRGSKEWGAKQFSEKIMLKLIANKVFL